MTTAEDCSAAATPSAVTAKDDEERQWTDAQVRWTAANHNLLENDNANDNNDANDDNDDNISQQGSSSSSSFQPDPTQTFSHRFQFPSDDDEKQTTIDIDLRGYEEHSDAIYISTGLTLWRSSELLCEYMLNDDGIQRLDNILQKTTQQEEKGGIRMLELGSGLGLAGILAHRLLSEIMAPSLKRSSTIVLTDGDTNALSVLRQNVENNTSSTTTVCSKLTTPTRRSISVEQLLWGEATASAFLKNRHQEQRFDIILAADAIYVLANVAPLLETVQVLLQRPHGEFWFSYCRRRQVSVQMEDVLQAADQIGFCWHDDDDHDEPVMEEDDILVYIFRWKKDA
jgi:predicted nicotinamide N-methyase